LESVALFQKLQNSFAQTHDRIFLLEMRFPIHSLGFALLLGFVPAANFAQEVPISTVTRNSDPAGRPLWEVGLAGVGGYVADYPGAAQSRFRGLPVPYFFYRGEMLRAGDGGIVRGRFQLSESLEFDLSFDGSLNADSDKNTLRRGMPDLDFLGEIGPQLTWRAWAEKDRSVTLNLPVRASLSFGDGGIRSRGLVLNPRITYRDRDFIGGNTLSLAVGPIFATEKLMDYFYEVRPQFALRGRPAFDADSGYLGSEVSIGLSRRLTPQIRLFLGSQIGLFSGATNRRSALLARETNWNFAVGASWAIWESSKRATD
jgi:outer membrane scaffolding protein for murein synthesis (MipA/OmpV family)